MQKKQKNTSSELVTFLRDRKVQLLFGVVLFFVSVCLALSLLSFISTGKNDTSIIYTYNDLSNKYQSVKHSPLTDENTKKNKLIEIKEARKITQGKAENLMGYRGAVIAENMINNWLGLGVFFILAFSFVTSIRLIGIKKIKIWKAFLFFAFLSVWTSLMCAFVFDNLFDNLFLKFGGSFGKNLSDWLQANIGIIGTLLVIITSVLVFLIITFSSTIPFFKRLYQKLSNVHIKNPFRKKSIFNKSKNKGNFDNEKTVKIGEILPEEWIVPNSNSKIEIIETVNSNKNKNTKTDNDNLFETVEIEADDDIDTNSDGEIEIVENKEDMEDNETKEEAIDTEPYDPKRDLSHYQYPTIRLLKDYPQPENAQSDEEKAANRTRIVSTLQKFGIGIKKIYETIGPTITLYEIVPDDGIRINKIRNLADDIMLSLAATGIRIIAPIPGKGTIGIEVPNSTPQIVSMFATIASKKFQEAAYDLPVAMGRTITNEVFMFDLCKMPHLLVAGATGQGKSVGLNAIITSLLYKKHPAELKFVLIDPKKVEFNIYADIERHFLAKLPEEDEPVITEVSKVIKTLNSLCKEMDTRYDLLKLAHARNIKEYNEKFISRHLNPHKGHKYLPYIVVIVDEFGDLIMTAGKEVELPIARIAQLARAVGIHMIIATQRPSVNIITGVIKANFPARVAFKVSSGVDSKTILDGSGAQQLIGRGDMLFSQGNEPVRVQCAFVDTPEVEGLVHFIGDQTGYPYPFPLPEPDTQEANVDARDIDLGKRDSMFDEVARLVVVTQQASASNIQRKFSIGFNRAARIVDQLEAAGIVGSQDGSKPRQVIIQTEYELEKILK
ncbi:MAG: DNA translocase FtsK [Prevotellaceae bacterium]|jgi:S-DNA-T family DNA segregation ATPase FtsK/SpoIIIE|nr:DNA translocase FtsK [Prevotellaceae bacterium]